MHKGCTCMAALLVVLALAGCQGSPRAVTPTRPDARAGETARGGGSTAVGTGREAVTPEPGAAGSPTGMGDAVPTTPDGTPLAQAMPYAGMDAALVDGTWLGPHDLEEPASKGARAGTWYVWLARNGTGDRVFSALARDGAIERVWKENVNTGYWRREGEHGTLAFPDLYGEGRAVKVPGGGTELPAPDDYDDPDRYAEDAMAWFAEHGSPDPYNEAVAYWERIAA